MDTKSHSDLFENRTGLNRTCFELAINSYGEYSSGHRVVQTKSSQDYEFEMISSMTITNVFIREC